MDAKKMSDNSRRTVCRLAFILLCALPLSLVIYRIVHPVSNTQWQQAIKANLGVATQIGSVETPLPFVTVFHDIKFTDPELEDIRLDKVKIVSGTTNEVIIEHPVQIDASALATISQRLRDSLMRTHAASNAWKISLNQTTILHPAIELPNHLELSSVSVSVFPYPDQTTAHVVATRADSPDNDIELSLRRIRNKQEPEEQFVIDTDEVYLPCWLMHDFWTQSKSFGTGSAFAGSFEITRVGKTWSCNVLPNSRIDFMDLQSLSGMFAKDVTGLCQSTIRSCEVIDGKIVELDIKLQCKNTTIDATTVRLAEQFLDAQWLRNTPTQSFAMLELDFQYVDGKISIAVPEILDSTQATGQQASLAFGNPGWLPIGDLAAFLEGRGDANNTSIDFLHNFQIQPEPNRVAEDSLNQVPTDLR